MSCVILLSQVVDRVKSAEGRQSNHSKLVVIFALLALVHTLHEATGATEVGEDFKAVVGFLEGMKVQSFVDVIAGDHTRYKLPGGMCFLSEMERSYISSKLRKTSFNDKGEDTLSADAPAVAPVEINK